MRIGHGYDAHRLKKGRKLILGGVTIPYEFGLDGHSDADVLTHAVIDAILGAAACEDIGALFPDNDDSYLDADSIVLLKQAYKAVLNKGYCLGNIDVTVIAQAPKLRPFVKEMQKNLSLAFACSEDRVNVKATTEEKMGFTGNGEGISAHAVCLLENK